MRKNYTKTYHIIFDAFGVDKKLLNNEKFALNLLLEIPKLIDMKILSGPNLVRDYDTGHKGLKVKPKQVETLEVKYSWEK